MLKSLRKLSNAAKFDLFFFLVIWSAFNVVANLGIFFYIPWPVEFAPLGFTFVALGSLWAGATLIFAFKLHKYWLLREADIALATLASPPYWWEGEEEEDDPASPGEGEHI